MRDVRRIREKEPESGRWAVVALWGGRLALLCLAFEIGRHVGIADDPAAVSDGPAQASTVHAQPQQTPALVQASAEPTTAPAPSVPAAKPVFEKKSTRSQRNAPRGPRPLTPIASTAPTALPDGLLPEQTGTARPGEFTVQISAFTTRDEAKAFCAQLSRRGFHPFVVSDAHGPRDAATHRVRMGRFARREEAQDYKRRLGRSDIPALVLQQD